MQNRRALTAPLALSLALAGTATAALATEGRKLSHTPIDDVVIFQDSISKSTPVRIRKFSTANADLGTGAKEDKPKYRQIAEEMKQNAPRLMVDAVLHDLKEAGFADVAELQEGEPVPAAALLIEGEFTKLNPGSQGKRYWVGFGAGKSQVCSKGRIAEGGTKSLAEFEHCRHEAIGFLGGDSGGQMTKDTHASGSHLAEFIVEWASGKYTR